MKLKRTRIATALAAVTVLVSAQAAFASTTLSVDGTTSPAGPVPLTATASTSIAFETNYGWSGTCLGSGLQGNLLRGASGEVGVKIGAITDAAFSSCSFTALNWNQYIYKKPSTPEWTIHLAEVPAPGASTVKVELRSFNLRMNSTTATGPWPCAANLAGTIKATITTGLNSRLIINTPALPTPNNYPLTIDALDSNADETNTSHEVTCGGEIWDGDLMSITGTYALNRSIQF